MADKASREKIFQIHLRNRPVEEGTTAAWLADQTEGFSGAGIAGVCRRAVMATIAEQVGPTAHKAAKNVQIRHKYFEAAIQEIGTQTHRTRHG